MSYRLTAWAAEVRGLTPTQKLVLMMLAHCCNGSAGAAVCWPSQARLAELTGLSERSVRYALRELEARCLIQASAGQGRTSSRYRLACDDSPNRRLDLPEPEPDPAREGQALPHKPDREGQPLPHKPDREGQQLPPRGATGAGRGATVAAKHRKEQGREQGAQRETQDSAPRDRAPEAAGAALSQAPDPDPAPDLLPDVAPGPVPDQLPDQLGDWRTIAARERPDIADPEPVWRKFLAYHRATAFADAGHCARAWALWLSRECRNRQRRYTELPEAVFSPGAFLAGIKPSHSDLTADYRVLRDE